MVLLKMTRNLFEAAESGCVTMPVAFDLSADFDTIDHQVLVRRLEYTFGIKGPTLSWVKTYLYLKEFSSFVKVGNAMSTTLSSDDTSVPQGSVLGTLLFSLFTTSLSDVISSFGIKFHQYANDTQIYLAVNKDS